MSTERLLKGNSQQKPYLTGLLYYFDYATLIMKNLKNDKYKNCSRCGKKPGVDGLEYCQICICDIVEKRVKKGLASARSDRSNYKLTIVCDDRSSLQCVAAAYLIKKVGGPAFDVEIITSESTSQIPETAAVILPKCADDLATGLIDAFISKKTNQEALQLFLQSKQPINTSNTINLFESVTEKELVLYADTKNLKYAKADGNWLRQKVRQFQKRYPGTIEALAKSSNQVKKLIGE